MDNQNYENQTPNNEYKEGEYHYSYVDNNLNRQTFNTYEAKPKQKKAYGIGAVILSAVIAAAVGAVSCFGIYTALNKNNISNQNPVTYLPNVESTGDTDTSDDITAQTENKAALSIAQAVAADASKSVVGIRTTTSVTSFFGGTSEETGEGSGVIYTADGYIITNYHVIEGAASSRSSKIEVFLDSTLSKSYQAQIIGYNIAADLAVIKINVNNLPAVKVGNSDSLKVGQYVVTIGAPGGLEFMGSVTYGIISGLNRSVSSSSGIGLIQTDAAINPGNSGGALLDENGKLIGINSSKIVSEEFEGMGFAIPVNKTVEICNKIISKKGVAEPYVGITISETYTAEVLEHYGYPTGAVVLSVASNSPAEEIGIRKGDIITEFAGVKITEYQVFEKELLKCKPDDTVKLKVYRSGRNYTTQITIGSNYAQ